MGKKQKHLKGRDVVMIGGEPNLFPKFPEYRDKLSHTATSLALITNGSLLRTRRDVIPTSNDARKNNFRIFVYLTN
jgi:organic radical activating enzyme